ncbi:MAG: DNA replication and repair protein RecF [Thermoanaerobacterales bacterium]|nr:DNA replication and repair protein RecF [Thermoanaerobacterales bacterium]
MWLEQLEGRDFRNYRTFSLQPHPGLNIVCGRNAQGKSNLIEACYMLLRGFSYRAVRQGEVIAWGARGTEVKGVLHTPAGRVEVAFALGPEGRRSTLAGETVSRSTLGAETGLVLFTPDDLWLIKSGPQYRRRFMDLELGPLRPGYLDDIQAYRRAVAQRNALLRAPAPSKDPSFALWTEQVARYGARVVVTRLEILRRLAPAVAGAYAAWTGAGGGEELGLRYLSAVELAGLTEADVAEALLKALETAYPRDTGSGQTTVGPHRDDLGLTLGGRPARLFASQGQQRSIILALKMAQLNLWRERLGSDPIVLLDDVLYELDEGRQERLLAGLRGRGQAFITVNRDSLAAGYGDRVFYVEEGRILKKGDEG